MKSRKSAIAVGLIALPALVLAGCDAFGGGVLAGGGTAKVKFTATYSGTASELPGTVTTPNPNGTLNIQNKTIKGTFSGKLPVKIDPTPPKKKSAGAAAGGIKSVSGTFIGRSSGTFNPATGTAELTGVQVLKFNGGVLGEACLKVTTKVTNGGNNETGTFTLVGGTKVAGRARFSGTYTGAAAASGYTGKLSGKGKLGKPARPHNADCKAIRGL
jgi:hypothetical protein